MNGFKSFLLVVALTGLLVWIGNYFYGQTGLVLALGAGLLLNAFAYFFSDSIVLASYGARVVSRQESPVLYDTVATLAQRAGLPMPRIAVIPDQTPNAFATGRNPEHAVVAITEGILQALSRQELEGVLAHELGHVKHRDILIGSLAAVLAQAIMFVSQMAMFFMPRGDDDEGPNPIAAIAVMIFGPVAAMLLQMALSRAREYMADEYSAHLTGRPDLLASALARISDSNARSPMRGAQPTTAHMMIVNPLTGGGLMGLFSTHPPIQQRIQRLNAMPIEAR
jgi:heat shock protein HtpX